MSVLDNIRFVLVGTKHPGNIGASARAMKTMGLSNLHLVAPKKYPSAEATARACGADDVLVSAVIHNNLDNALSGCHYVYGMSARLRHLPLPIVSPREAVIMMKQHQDSTHIAVMFGPEHSGLANKDMDRCHYLINIPANPDYSSLNLASAVQVLAYEVNVMLAPRVVANAVGEDCDSVTADDLEQMYAHLERTLTTIGFLNPDNPRKLMRRLRRLFNRSALDRNELHILHGILRAAETYKGESS